MLDHYFFNRENMDAPEMGAEEKVTKAIRVMSEDDAQDEAIDKLKERVDKLEKWQAFVFGAAAATGAFVGVGLTLASLLLGGK